MGLGYLTSCATFSSCVSVHEKQLFFNLAIQNTFHNIQIQREAINKIKKEAQIKLFKVNLKNVQVKKRLSNSIDTFL